MRPLKKRIELVEAIKSVFDISAKRAVFFVTRVQGNANVRKLSEQSRLEEWE